jgi:hypothetical protein
LAKWENERLRWGLDGARKQLENDTQMERLRNVALGLQQELRDTFFLVPKPVHG